MCVKLLEGLKIKYVKGDISIRDSFKNNVNQESWGHIDPMIPKQGYIFKRANFVIKIPLNLTLLNVRPAFNFVTFLERGKNSKNNCFVY